MATSAWRLGQFDISSARHGSLRADLYPPILARGVKPEMLKSESIHLILCREHKFVLPAKLNL